MKNLVIIFIFLNSFSHCFGKVYSETLFNFDEKKDLEQARRKVISQTKKLCNSSIRRLENWSNIPLGNKGLFLLSSTFECQEWGGRSCFEPKRRCNDGRNNLDCPPCY